MTGSQTVPGSSENTFRYTFAEGTDADDYRVETQFGTLTVAGRGEEILFPITVAAVSDEVRYDGSEHTAEGFLAEEYTVDGSTYTVEGLTAEASGTHAGSYERECPERQS